jgi:CheY-like chemotaxis protein
MRKGSGNGPLLLLIEEDPGLQSLFTELLTEEGYELVCARSLEEGFRRVEEQTFALVLADVFLGPSSRELPRTHALRSRIYPVPLALLAHLPLPLTEKQTDFAFVLPLPFNIEDCLSQIATTLDTPLSAEHHAQAQVVQRLLEAIEAGNWEAMTALHTNDVICVPPEHSRGTSARWLEGQAAFRNWAMRLVQTYQQLRVRMNPPAATPRGLAVRYTMHWQEAGGPVQRAGTLFLRFRGERICQVGIRINLPPLSVALAPAQLPPDHRPPPHAGGRRARRK